MKYLFVFTALFTSASFPCLAQKENIDTVQFNYSGVVEVDSATAKVLQQRARLFVAESFKSANDVVQLDDRDAGVMLIKGNISPAVKMGIAGYYNAGYVNFTIKIQFKDGKYKYTFSDFYHEGINATSGQGKVNTGGSLVNVKPGCGTFLMSEGFWRKIKVYTNDDVLGLIAHLKKDLKNTDAAAQKDSF